MKLKDMKLGIKDLATGRWIRLIYLDDTKKVTGIDTYEEFRPIKDYDALRTILKLLQKNGGFKLAVLPEGFNDVVYYRFKFKCGLSPSTFDQTSIIECIVDIDGLEEKDLQIGKSKDDESFLNDFDREITNWLNIPPTIEQIKEEYQYKNDRIIKDIIDFYEIRDNKDYSKIGKYIDSIYPRCMENLYYLSQLAITLMINFHDLKELTNNTEFRVSYKKIKENGDYDIKDISKVFKDSPLEYNMLLQLYNSIG